MATARARGIPADENALQPLRGVKAGDAAANAAPKRRALGDIGNVVQTFNDHCQVSKGVPKKEAPAQAQKPQEEKQQAHLSEKQSTEPGNENPAGRRTLRASTLAQRDRYHVSATRSMGRRSMSSSLQTNSDEALRLSTKLSRRSAARSSAPHSPLPDIDSRDRRDPLQLTDYVQDLQDYWKRIEAIPRFKVDPEYMTIQRDINAKMRSILVSWLVEVHYKFKLAPETLFLTVNIIDRFLSRRSITRNYLQLIGCCGMLIASKYEEVFAPEVNDFVFISDNAYTKEEVLKMERIMLSVLKYEMCVPTVFHFIARYLKAVGIKGRLQPQDGKMVYDDQQDAYVAFTAHYFAELSLIHYSFLQWKPSEIAAACVYAAMRTMNRQVPFPYALQKHSGYSEEHVKRTAETLVAEHQREPSRAQTVNAVWRKYQSSKFLKVSVSVQLCEALLPAAPGATGARA